MKITVIGCGRWGSFIAWYLDKIGHEVTLYGRSDSKHFIEFLETRSNGLLTLRESVKLDSNLGNVVEADVVVISVPSQALRGLLKELVPFDLHDKYLVLCMKGLEIATGKRLTEVVDEYIDRSNSYAVWLGPGHVQEFVKGVPNCMVIDAKEESTKEFLVNQFSSDLIRFYYGNDLIGNEIGAAAKNVIGIAAGILDGLSLTSLKGALMSRGTREIARLIAVVGGNEFSAYGLCHLGDYEATVFSPHSHNRKFGEMIVKQLPYQELAEGYYTVKALMNLSERYQVELPICNAVYQVLYLGKDSKETIFHLFERSIKSEF